LIVLSLSSCVPRLAQKAPLNESRELHAGKTFTDALGRRYVQESYPRRIVSLVPSVTEILFAIHAGDRVVGVTRNCDYPEDAQKRTSVGSFPGAGVSVERIRSLRPDLVILSADVHSGIVVILDNFNIPSFAAEPRNFSEVFKVISMLGEITGCAAGAKETISEMMKKIAGAEKQTREHERPGVFWIVSDEPLMTAGEKTFISEAIKFSGGNNIFDDMPEQWPLVSQEQVLLRKPDIILRGNDMGSGRNSSFQGFSALREARTVTISTEIFYRYGPRLADGVELLAKILHSSD